MDITDFFVDFWYTFCYPLIEIMKDFEVLNVPLWDWLLGYTLALLAVKIFRYLFKVSDGDK